MPFFRSSKSWGAQMNAPRVKGTKTAKEAKADADKKNNPSKFRQRKAAAKGKKW